MDRVRFGRALGYGARHAAKTLAQAVDAAASPSPTEPARRPAQASSPDPRPTAGPQRAAQAQRTVHSARKQAKSSFFSPIARFSSVLWLQVTGTFFALVAVTMGAAAWRARAAWHQAPSSHPAIKLYVYLGVFAVFAYFAISSFLRAERR